MAKKYQGRYSPDAPQNSAQIRTGKVEEVRPQKMRLLKRLRTYRIFAFVLGIAGLFQILGGSPFAGLISLASLFSILFASEITKAGLEAEAAYDAKAIARAPAFPRKTIGAIMMGLTVFIASKFSVGADWLPSIGVGLVAGIGMLLSFGLDPMRSKGLAGENRYEAGRTAEAIEKAQAMIDEIRAMSRALSDRRAKLEVESLALSAEDMFRALEEDPSDYRNSRRYLGVYLQGARDATSQFLQLPKSEQTAEAEAKYLALIRELDEGFRQKRETILADNRNSLDIEIDVLRERLASEGIKIPKEETS